MHFKSVMQKGSDDINIYANLISNRIKGHGQIIFVLNIFNIHDGTEIGKDEADKSDWTQKNTEMQTFLALVSHLVLF